KPLLHMWSLGVEEQFYIVWPALLMLLFSRKTDSKWGRLAIGAILVVSFTATQFVLDESPNAAFYLPHLRAWEFALGALAFFCDRVKPARWIAELALGFGGLLVAGSCVLLSERTRFPGLNALPACVGTALCLWARSPA